MLAQKLPFTNANKERGSPSTLQLQKVSSTLDAISDVVGTDDVVDSKHTEQSYSLWKSEQKQQFRKKCFLINF